MVTLLYLYRLPEYVLLFCGILEKEKTFKKNWCYINLEWLCIPYIFQWTLLFLAPVSTVFTFNNTKKTTTIFECALTGIMYDIFHFTKQYQKKRMRCTCFCSSLYTLYRIRICCGVQQTMKAVRTTTNILITYRTEGQGSFREAGVNKLTNRSVLNFDILMTIN